MDNKKIAKELLHIAHNLIAVDMNAAYLMLEIYPIPKLKLRHKGYRGKVIKEIVVGKDSALLKKGIEEMKDFAREQGYVNLIEDAVENAKVIRLK